MAQKKPSLPMTPLRPLPIRIAKLHAHLMISAAFGGIVLFALVFADWRLPTKLLAGWDAGVALYLVLMQSIIWRCDIDHLRKRASEQDEGAFAILLLTIAATLASLVAIVFELGGLKQATPSEAASQVLLAMVTILLSWSFIHTIFSIHYAHEYYGERSDGKIGGLNFPEDNEPDYLGFSLFLAGRRPDLASFRRRRHQQGHSPRGGAARRAVVLLQPDDIGADREHDLECLLAPLANPAERHGCSPVLGGMASSLPLSPLWER